MAEAAVHTAQPDDIDQIARIQVETWRAAYASLLPDEVLAGLDQAEIAEVWQQTVKQGDATVHVATEGTWTVGFCAAGPAPDTEVADADGTLPDDAGSVGMIATLLVEPRWGRRGHGGRLLASAAAGLRATGKSRGVVWVPENDDVSVAFYERAGWQRDGMVRTLDAGGRPLREVRLTGELDLRLA
ncbi:GNAT family N-acetyltransferase [Kibdelosporangium phytohabitans]|uniref:GCN5 family acetyltransferase n=1 Tax=Kibdelosporangium phytohabitans TaxID=860235 RepID=A0A0N9IDT1_9PSEU|nr:GNAT family N-acetyltransferase [Kibdelosporangium phytohabitans]ALG12905.1 GCN5 family acetyltransferase [Kibdelosporangium phytohabitans]MBE1464611.1 GNAT superfamily N-acetyltransferase [Kibdelosporangium phytohabitans]